MRPQLAAKEATCGVCFDDISDDRIARLMPCRHQFCYDCTISWVKKDNTCPHCRCTTMSLSFNGDVIPVVTPMIKFNVCNYHGYNSFDGYSHLYHYSIDKRFLPSMFESYWGTCHQVFKSASVKREDVSFHYYPSHTCIERTDTAKSLGMTHSGNSPLLIVIHHIKLNIVIRSIMGNGEALLTIWEEHKLTVKVADHIDIGELAEFISLQLRFRKGTDKSMFEISSGGKILTELKEYTLHDLDFMNDDIIFVRQNPRWYEPDFACDDDDVYADKLHLFEIIDESHMIMGVP